MPNACPCHDRSISHIMATTWRRMHSVVAKWWMNLLQSSHNVSNAYMYLIPRLWGGGGGCCPTAYTTTHPEDTNKSISHTARSLCTPDFASFSASLFNCVVAWAVVRAWLSQT